MKRLSTAPCPSVGATIKRARAPQCSIPRFYFGEAKKVTACEAEMSTIASAFGTDGFLSLDGFDQLSSQLGLPSFFGPTLHQRTSSHCGCCSDAGLKKDCFCSYWSQHLAQVDQVTRFYRLLKGDVDGPLVPEDFRSVIEELVLSHAGLAFLREAPAFEEPYISTIITRIFFAANRRGDGRISLSELRRSCVVDAFMLIDHAVDINEGPTIFSYEHFYVIYMAFWELDEDRDMMLTRSDLLRYGNRSLGARVVMRIIDGVPRPLTATLPRHMSYQDFVWFMLAEEDKTAPASLDYWFRVADVDVDGLIDRSDMEYFYAEQEQRLRLLALEPVPFEDMLCQIHDAIGPRLEGEFYLSDLRRSTTYAPMFFDMLFNLNKFLGHERRDPLSIKCELAECPGLSPWDRFARTRYAMLAREVVAEEEEENVRMQWMGQRAVMDASSSEEEEEPSCRLGHLARIRRAAMRQVYEEPWTVTS